jgi:glycosyltransferase involved in cell wall biosynthesis
MQWSVVVPTYNYGRFIEQCLQSILCQHGEDYEIILIDDGSTDDTRSVAERFVQQLPAGRLRYLYQENQGPAAARNRGIDEAKGEFVWFLDSDDRLIPGAFAHMQSAIERHRQGELFFGGYRSVAQNGNGTDKIPGLLGADRTENFKRYLQKELKTLTTGAVAVRKTALGNLRFPEGIHINEDVVLFGHLIARCETVAVSRVLVEKIRHPASLRGDMARIEETGLRSVDYLFDGTRLTAEQMKLRSGYLANRCLRLCRAHYLHGNYARARSYYVRALKACPGHLFKLSYLIKYLRSLGK